jgi:predicted small metal-binding protein
MKSIQTTNQTFSFSHLPFQAARFRMMNSKEENMLYKYTCKGMGLNCPFMVTGITEEEVTKKALEHVLEHHTKDFNSIKTPEEIKRMELALSRSTRVVVG